MLVGYWCQERNYDLFIFFLGGIFFFFFLQVWYGSANGVRKGRPVERLHGTSRAAPPHPEGGGECHRREVITYDGHLAEMDDLTVFFSLC